MHFETFKAVSYVLSFSMFLFFVIGVYRWFRNV